MRAVALPWRQRDMPTGLWGRVEGQARGGLNRGSPASERGDCSSKNEDARATRSAGLTTAATCWAVACDRQWPLWHANCRSGVSGPEPWSRFITTTAASALVKPKSHPLQWISETSKPSVSNRTNGRRPSRLPVLVPATVTLTCIISTQWTPRIRRFQGPVYQTTWSSARAQGDAGPLMIGPPNRLDWLVTKDWANHAPAR